MAGFAQVFGKVFLAMFVGHSMAIAQVPPKVNSQSTGMAQPIRVDYAVMIDPMAESSEHPINGSAHLDEAFKPGRVVSNLGSLEMDMRYNIYLDRIEYNQNDTLYYIGPNPMVDKVEIGTQTFIVENFETREGTYPSFYLRLDSGKISLLTKMTIRFSDRQQGTPIRGVIPAKYERVPDVNYLKLEDGSLKEIKNIKKLTQALLHHGGEMEKFAKENKISPKNKEELIQFTQYYNSLE